MTSSCQSIKLTAGVSPFSSPHSSSCTPEFIEFPFTGERRVSSVLANVVIYLVLNKLHPCPHASGTDFVLSILLLILSGRPPFLLSFRPSFSPSLGVGFADELTDCCCPAENASTSAYKLLVMDFYALVIS